MIQNAITKRWYKEKQRGCSLSPIPGRKNKRVSNLNLNLYAENLNAEKDAFTNTISFNFTTLSIAIATKCDTEQDWVFKRV